VTEEPTMQAVRDLLDAARLSDDAVDSAAEVHFDDPEKMRQLAAHVLERLETVDRVVRILAAKVEELTAQAEPSEGQLAAGAEPSESLFI
jgi:hypothetical protein